MVVFEQGVPKKAWYRRFNIRTVSGPDDFASMEEVLSRRFNRWQAAQETAGTPGVKNDPAFALLPDLVLIDGGKGQLARAVKVLDRFSLSEKVPVASLAKQMEEIFMPGQTELHPAAAPIPRLIPGAARARMKRIAMLSPLTASGATKPGLLRAWMPSPGLDQRAGRRSWRISARSTPSRKPAWTSSWQSQASTRRVAEEIKAHLE